jgi:23S rRNA (uracil1939-C5)-methyltransferase
VSPNDPIRCDHAERCGGCPAIHLPYADQLSLKRGRLVSALARYPSLELVYADPVLPAEPVRGYRTRAKLMVAPRGVVGLFAKGGGHEVVDVPGCQVLSPVLARVTEAVRVHLRAHEEANGPLVASGLRAIDVRELLPERDGAATALLTLVVQRAHQQDVARLREAAAALMRDVPEIVGVAANIHDGASPQVLGAETVHLAGASSAPDRVGVSVHMATFGSFVQAHRAQAARVHELLATSLGLRRREPDARPRMLDLYAGSGAIAFALAELGARVTCVEAFGPAAARIEHHAGEAKLDVGAIHADVGTALRTLHERETAFDAVVANPPRRGIGPAAREWLGRLGTPMLAYVSCDPETLARDLDHLGRLGYRCASTQPLDMIPLSDEVETVAVLRRAPVPSARVLYEDDSVLIVDKAPHEPTTPQAEYAGSLLARVRTVAGASGAVPVHRLDVGTSGVCIFARTPEHAAAWKGALGADSTRKIYLAGTRGIVPSKGTISRELRDGDTVQTARTKYRRLAVFAGHAIARVMPEHGRTHQIRRHMAQVGHALLGDDRYGHAPTNRHFEEKYGLDRTFLHCVRLEIDHPVSKLRLVVESPVPGDLTMVLERAGGPGTLRFLEAKHALGRAGTSSFPPGTSSVVPPSSSRDPASDAPRAELVGEDDER